jgi:regulator of sigma E protease
VTILIFILILSVLVFVHEAGHFLAAKAFGIRVDEFGFGYPPRAKKLGRWKGTDVTLNWLPFGGFVKIFGENYEDKDAGQTDGEETNAGGSFSHKNRGIQAFVLVAGVLGNVLLAWVLLSLGFMIGMPSPAGLDLPLENAHTAITQILPGSPAAQSGIKTGDEVLLITRGDDKSELTPEAVSEFIAASDAPVQITVKRGGEIFTEEVTPTQGIVSGKPAIGVGLDTIGTVKLNPLRALYEGTRATGLLLWYTASAFGHFITEIFSGHPNLGQVTGPVGIVGMVGDARSLGLVYLLSFAALISLNLAVINLFPFPALDGGRLLFVGIEAVTRRRIPAKFFQLINFVGFAILILLMVIITIRDIGKAL